MRVENLAPIFAACSIARMSNSSDERLMKLMTAARQSPDFGVRLMAQLPLAARSAAVRCWALGTPLPAPVALKPGLRKCGEKPEPTRTFESAQLEAYARTIGRLG
jgi:hypothetical protein